LSNFTEKIVIRPVLGQAIQVQLDRPLGSRDFQPVITGNDVHIVPLEDNQYAIGATVEFANELNEVEASADLLEKIEREAISFCPLLAHAKLIRQWSGMRPRPEGISAPIVQKLPEFERVILATGHYRNGVLLAPATAQIVQELLLTNAPS
jgi:glycine/D-amino acid oxidase-like deaminating enzyme